VSATLLVAGDLCPTGSLGAALSASAASDLWSEVSPVIKAADFAVVNLECPLTDHPQPILKSGQVFGAREVGIGIRAAGLPP